jgi:hypothetical protein
MKQTVNIYQFRNAFRAMDREKQFSYEGLEQLFNYLEELEEDTGEEMELDVIAICCDYAEANYKDIARNYNIELPYPEPLYADQDEENLTAVRKYLEDEGALAVDMDNGHFIYCQF